MLWARLVEQFLTNLELKPDIEFGIGRSAAIAASRGLNVLVLVVGRMVNRMIEEIDEINMKTGDSVIFEVKDALHQEATGRNLTIG